jgi:hypothetical protein
MSFDLYQKICQWLMESDDANAAYAHCFLTLTWNLMCRSRSTVNLQYEHVGWYNDAMGIKFGHNKTDQDGKLQWKVRHIYANPQMPKICPILSFARWRVHQNGVTSGPVFPGSKQYDRFRAILGEICESHQSSIDTMGLYFKDIGVHSIRKGAATYCCNGSTCGVSFPAVCCRAGWSMGGTVDRYIQLEAAGDQVCGRTVTGLDVNSFQFGISPPFFTAKMICQRKGMRLTD